MMGVGYNTQNTLVVLALALVLVVLSTWNTIEGIAPFRSSKSRKGKKGKNRKNRRVTSGPSKTWLSTYFSDGGNGVTGVPFSMYPITWKGKKLFPAAVHERDAGKYLYKIMRVTLPKGGSAYVHIVDVCNKCDKECGSSVQIGGKSYNKMKYNLLDIHSKAFQSGGFSGKADNSYNPRVRIVGHLKRNKMKLPKGWYITSCRSGSRQVNCGSTSQAQDFSKYCTWSGR